MVEAHEYPWPVQVPILEADNIHIGGVNGISQDCHCLSQWAYLTFVKIITPSCIELHNKRRGDRVLKALVVAIKQMAPKWYAQLDPACNHRGDISIVINFNDSNRRDKHKVARVWNRAQAMLGYTDGNPEARYTKGVTISTRGA